jgi:hypothetical protein
VGGGSGCDPFALLFGECGGAGDTFDDLLASFEGEPNNVLVAQLLTGRRGKVSDEANASQNQVITGSAAISIVFPGQCCPPFAGGGEEGGFLFFKNAS